MRARWSWGVLVAALGALAAAALRSAPPEAARALNFTSLATRLGYPCEEHTVATADGYLLTLFRIPLGRRCVGGARRTPVLLVPGLLLGAEAWLAAGAAGLALLLPDACHDTWLASARGTTHARRHRSLDPADARFWRFSADEMAAYDAPATVDYVLRATGAARLNYVGFSQGASVALMLLAERPQFARKLGVLLAAAPPTTLAHTTSPLGWLLAAAARLEPALAAAGVHEVLASGGAVQRLAARFCAFRVFRDTLCRGALEALDAANPGSIADETFATLYGHFPAGTSVRTLARYGQVQRSGLFQKYDFGERGNLAAYGSARPPEYALGAVAAPVVLLQGRGDALVALPDTRRLAAQLPNLQELYIVDDPNWNHFDVVYSRNINESIFSKINEYLVKYSTC